MMNMFLRNKNKHIIEISLLNRLMMEQHCHPLSGKCASSWSSLFGKENKKYKTEINVRK